MCIMNRDGSFLVGTTYKTSFSQCAFPTLINRTNTTGDHVIQDTSRDETAMGAFTSTSTSPSHFSPQAIGLLIGAGAVVLILIILWVYIARQGGPSETLRSFCERREANKKAGDIEMAEATANADRVLARELGDKQCEAERNAARQEALDQLNGLFKANKLIGSSLPSRPQQVNFDEERYEKQREQERLRRGQRGEQLRAMALMHEQEGRRPRPQFKGRDRPRVRADDMLVKLEAAGKSKKPSNLCNQKDSLDLAIDPMSHTWGSGRTMAGLYR
ncbi:hypothetical protein EJ07DRAFT_158688 [Lizonia empirigonia]|nr:hypothetical protein EJ07DRAFT_158688 [Lizonia empirigonia]